VRWILVLVGLSALLAGCGASSHDRAQPIERSFDVHWHDRAASTPITYTTDHLVFHDGRWSARISVTNRTGGAVFELTWAVAGDWRTWNGPALVYPGEDVLGGKHLIYVPADQVEPPIPYPLRNGATWAGTIQGKIPSAPLIPHGQPIWFRYPVFNVGAGVSGRPVQWISEKSVQL
jgi:hypothetical protein